MIDACCHYGVSQNNAVAFSNSEGMVKPARPRSTRPTRVALEVTARRFHLESEGAVPCCPSCDQLLNLHQPDENQPGRLLATCDACLKWYLLFEAGEGANQFVMVELPDCTMVELPHD